MYKHILVPLDGSALSESSIPVAVFFAIKFNSTITLLHIVERDAPEKIHGEHHIQNYSEAVEYLERIAGLISKDGIKVNYHGHDDGEIDVVKAIAMHHEELVSDMIVMSTHGWGGIKEIFFGNFAQQVLNYGTMPVLFIPPKTEKVKNKFNLKHILLPLDSTEEHEAGLNAAMKIASFTKSEIYLAVVVPTSGTLPYKTSSIDVFLPSTVKEVLNLYKVNAEKYLSDKIKFLKTKGIKTRGEVKRGDPSRVISGIANKKEFDLTIIGTHGKAGLNAFWSGSVAAKITGRAHGAILFIPIK